MRKISHAREQLGDVALDRTQERARQTAKGLNAVDGAIATIARELRGLLPLAMGNVDYTLSAGEGAYSQFSLSGAHTAVRRLVFPSETDDTSRVVWISNITTGGFAITIVTNDGSASVPNGTTCAVRISGSGPARLT